MECTNTALVLENQERVYVYFMAFTNSISTDLHDPITKSTIPFDIANSKTQEECTIMGWLC